MIEPPQIEPAAEMRRLAALYRQQYVAFTQAGFTEAQAMDLLCELIWVANASEG